MEIIRDIVYGTQDCESQVLDLYLPENNAADVLIYFHGGGIECGNKSWAIPFKDLAEAGKIVISANYRMYPKAKYPEFLEDTAAVVNWAKENLHKYKEVKKYFVGGSSAGAYLTAMLAYDEKYLGAYNIKTTDIDGYIINSAQMTTHFNILRERGIDTKRIIVDEAAPVYHITEKTEFPNVLILVSDNDMPCRFEQTQMFLKTLEMFQCPQERVQYRLMKGFKHCGYDNTEEFTAFLLQYMDSIK